MCIIIKEFQNFWVHITPKANQYSLKYFGTNSSWNILFSCVFTAHTTLKAKQYFPNYFGTNRCQNIPFVCVLSAHIMTKAKQIFPKVFRCWQLLKSFISTCIECTYYVELAKCTAVCWAVIWTNVGHSNIHIMFVTGPHYSILTWKNALGPPRSSNV